MARSAASYILMLDEQSSQAQNVLHTFVCLTRQRRARHKVLHKNAFYKKNKRREGNKRQKNRKKEKAATSFLSQKKAATILLLKQKSNDHRDRVSTFFFKDLL